jgi:imidazolonepropionase-like amidohydrolase
MKKIFIYLLLIFPAISRAQENMHPSPAQTETIALIHGVIHVGNGQVIPDGMIVFSGGKIVDVRPTAAITDVKVIDLKGKQIYPGLISPITNLGLSEVASIRASRDFYELGEMNPGIRSLVAYNTDSKVINVVRSNGILLANIVPSGSLISGSSSVVQLDAWNWEDAAYKKDNGIHLYMPNLINPPTQYQHPGDPDPVKQGLEKIESVRVFFREAKAYYKETSHAETNIKFEAVRGLFDQSKIFFVHCDLQNEIMIAIEIAKEFNFKLVLVNASECYLMTDLLKQNNVSVILAKPSSLPNTEDDDVDQPYKTAAVLQKAGILFSICFEVGEDYLYQRNLPFQAGVMAAHGLTKEEALTSITLNAAKILGIDQTTGSLEKGKDANIVVSEGDILDMRTSIIDLAFIQGRQIDLNNKQIQLFEKYKYKYGIK